MALRQFFASFLALLLVALAFLYFLVPLNNIDFGGSSTRNYNFSTGGGNASMQFYPNMRYQTPDISYTISPDCPLQKTDEATRAFEILGNDTTLSFYPVSSGGQIAVSCQDKVIVTERNTFVAGEGGPVNITQAGNFNVIFNGTVLLIRDSQCAEPNIAIHEILHALGFVHSSNPKNVMYPVTSCDQTIGQDTIETIDQLYSVPGLPDLLFKNVSANLNGRYLDTSIVVFNYGLASSGPATLDIYADNSKVKTIDLPPMDVGDGRVITLTNIFVLQPSVKQVRFVINADFKELEKENNEAVLNYSN